MVDEAERRKLITIDYETWSAYFWIPPERRKKEKLRTEELEKLVESAFLEKNTEKLSEDELREILVSKGLSTDEVERVLYEAERYCVLSSYPFTKRGWIYELIPPEERENELEWRRLGKLDMHRWIYRRLMLGLSFRASASGFGDS